MKASRGNRSAVRRCAVAASILAATGLTACGSSTHSSTPGTNGTSASAPTGSPINLLAAVPGESDVYGLGNLYEGLQAAVDSINASGGIDKHPLNLVRCDAGQPIGNPQGTAACGQAALSSNVVAVVGTFTTYAGPLFSYIRQKSIPSLASVASSIDNIQSTDPLSWVVQPASIQIPAQTIMALGLSGCKKVAEFFQSTNNIADAQGAAIANAAAKYANVGLVRVPLSPTQTDFAPAIAQAQSAGADCIAQELPNTTLGPILTAIKDSGKSMQVGSTIANDSPQVLAALGSAANGVVIQSPVYPPGIANPVQLDSDFAKYAPNTPKNAIQEGDWENVEIVAQALKKAVKDGKPLTGASVQAELGTLCNIAFGVQPTLNFCQTGTFPKEPRVFDNTVFAYKYANGTFTQLSKTPIDAGAAINKYAPGA